MIYASRNYDQSLVNARVDSNVSIASASFFDTNSFPPAIGDLFKSVISCNPVYICNEYVIDFFTKTVRVCKSVVCEATSNVCDACITCTSCTFS